MAIATFFQRMDMKNIPLSMGSLLDIPTDTQVKLISDDGKTLSTLSGHFELSPVDFSLMGTISTFEQSISGGANFKFSMNSNNDVKTLQSFIDAKNGVGFLGYVFNGNDQITGSASDDIVGGFTGNDTIDGGAGNDVVFFTSDYASYTITPTATDVTVKQNTTGEIDTLSNVEMLAFTDKTIPTPAPETPVTTPVTTTQISKKPSAGNDLLTGTNKTDTLNGLAGNDTLIGGGGADKLTGGVGKDVFKFNNITDSGITEKSRDIITDFNAKDGDKIDLSAIDANLKLTKDQAFIFIGTAKFSTDATGQMRFDPKTHVLYASNDKDAAAEFSIQLTGVNELTADDLIL